MTTENISVGADWQLVIDDAEREFLITSESSGSVEYAATDADTPAPTVVRGHTLRDREALTRGAIGVGFIWARSTGMAGQRLVVS